MTALVRLGHGLGVLGISLTLLIAFVMQFMLSELPCPLCMLQRVAFALCGFGFLLNLRFGSQPLHYGITIFSAMFGLFVASRQVLLHIVPGSGAYGSTVLDLHLDTWSAVLFLAIIAGTAVLMILEGRGEKPDEFRATQRFGGLYRAIGYLLVVMTLASAINSFLQCGPVECADDPTGYWIVRVLH